MITIPSPILEAVDGTFLILLFFMAFSSGQYAGRSSLRAYRAGVYPEEVRAAWAIFALFIGLILRVGMHWLSRHAANHGFHWPWLAPVAPIVILASTVVTAWAGICWIRIVIPLRCARRSWIVASALALTFGFYMALGGS